ncbi:hypothetical protein HGRIS_002616 [Hohenbuehelia grisea]|uniref:Secreted protein n=1 Tax=Hohenbuehelia grisea TaxID=104357 RepID=A0ABR3JMX0_9AGAR
MFNLKFATLASVTIGAGLASAQQLTLSSNCQTALSNVLTNADTAACLNPSALVSVALNGGNASIVDPINNWLTGFCNAAPCSNDTLSTATRNLLSGCAADLGPFSEGINADEVVAQVQQIFPTFRKVACLKEGNSLCVTKVLTDAQNLLGTLSINNAMAVFAKARTLTEIPTNITCTNCVKAAYNIVKQDFPDAIPSQDVSSVCGASFIDGNTPSGISQSLTDSGNKASNNNAALAQSVLGGIPVVGTLFASAAFFML